MRVAITGIAGYLGQLLARRLDREPRVEEILGLDVRRPEHEPSKLRFRSADLRTADFAPLLRGCDVVYHLGFVVTPLRGMSAATIDEINVEGSRRLFAGAIAAGVPKLVFASSLAVYGAHPDNPIPLDEDSPLRPNDDWYYSRGKGRVEAILDRLEALHPERVVIRFRPSILLGPTARNVVTRLLSGRVLVSILGRGKMGFCWDEDAVEAFCLALDHGRSDVFNLTGDGALTLEECGELLGRRVIDANRPWVIALLGTAAALRLLSPARFEWIVAGARGPIVATSTRARARLGWRPRYDSRETVRRFAEGRREQDEHGPG